MPNDFTQHHWNTLTEMDIRELFEITLFEDTENQGDLTCLALISSSAQGAAAVVARSAGVLAGVPLIPVFLASVDHELVWESKLSDSDNLQRGSVVGTIRGPARSLLTAERPILNFLGRLSGVASITRRYVEAIQGTGAKIYDTRKTTPGWRLLEKYAVGCGGGTNHRAGLYDAILIKDNHLALGRQGTEPFTPAEAVRRAKDFLLQHFSNELLVEIEVDTLDQLREVLPAEPNIVLLDNMPPQQITEAVRIRNMVNPKVQLEASGGINLETVRAVAETGVERISVGALTHSAVSLDFGLDWE